MFRCNPTVVELVGATLVTALFAVPLSGHAKFSTVESGLCDTPFREPPLTAVAINDTLNHHAGSEEHFAIEISEPGILDVELSVPGPALAEPKLLLVARCRSSAVRVLSRSVSQLLVAVDHSGTYYFRGASQDALTPLGAYKLTTAFTALDPAGLDPAGLRPLDPKGDPDPEVIEIDADEGTIEIDPGSRIRQELCRAAEVDDHADRFLCATAVNLGSRVSGAVNSRPWDDDNDLFVVDFDGHPGEPIRTIVIETRGETDTFGSLYDRFGHRLAKDDDGGPADNFRIVKTLAPGTYFIRVEGRQGPYSLAVSSSTW